MKLHHLLIFLFTVFSITGCSSIDYKKTVGKVDLQKFMGPWYVLAGRFTFLEQDVYNGIEVYKWNEKKNQIDIGFTYSRGSFNGPRKSIPQTGWVKDKTTNAHWLVSPLWPTRFDYLIIALADDYSWTAIGVPNGKYLWIMARDWQNPAPVVSEVVKRLKAKGYNVDDLVLVPQRH